MRAIWVNPYLSVMTVSFTHDLCIKIRGRSPKKSDFVDYPCVSIMRVSAKEELEQCARETR